MEVADSSETLLTTYETIRCHSSEDHDVNCKHLFILFILHFQKRAGTHYNLIELSVMSERGFFRTVGTKVPLVKGQQRIRKQKSYIYIYIYIYIRKLSRALTHALYIQIEQRKVSYEAASVESHSNQHYVILCALSYDMNVE
jgi:hypothetical protein